MVCQELCKDVVREEGLYHSGMSVLLWEPFSELVYAAFQIFIQYSSSSRLPRDTGIATVLARQSAL